MARGRDTKSRAQRIDIGYLARSHWLRSTRGWLGLAALIVLGAWITKLALVGDTRPVSPGPITAAHRMIADKCEKCHSDAKATWSLRVTDDACQSCHRVAVHQPIEGKTPACATCHMEHRTAPALLDVATARCTVCHADLKDRRVPAVADGMAVKLALGSTKIATFGAGDPTRDDGHKEFAVWEGPGSDRRKTLDAEDKPSDLSPIKFNHARHLSPNLPGPDREHFVQLVCADCHRGPFEPAKLPYGRRNGASPAPALPDRPEFAPAEEAQYFAPVSYEAHCAACHPHRADDQIPVTAPHDTPEVVRAFLEGAYARYALTNPKVLEGTPRIRPVADGAKATSAKSREEWAREQVDRAEDLFYRRPCIPGERCLRCVQCHFFRDDVQGEVPTVQPPAIRSRWLPQSRFDHAAHRDVDCEQCHAGVKTSTLTTDVLIPRIATCRRCHHAGGASDRCAECHTYHGAMAPHELDGPHTIDQLTSSSDGGGT
jgi:hypothetical protein